MHITPIKLSKIDQIQILFSSLSFYTLKQSLKGTAEFLIMSYHYHFSNVMLTL